MTDAGEIGEQIRLFLPKWLSPERQGDLWNELRSFPHNKTIYTTRSDYSGPLQGDVWRGFIALDFTSHDDKIVSGLVLSNSCDIAPANKRLLTPNVVFVPLVNLERYIEMLTAAGQNPQQRDDVLSRIRKQEVTSVMHLPGVQGVMNESVAVFHDVHSHPLDHFEQCVRSRVVRLSDFGFYLFLFKLSIHFTRMLEDVNR